MLAMIIDVETTGLVEADGAECAEIGFVILDVGLAKIRSVWSEVVEFDGPNGAEEVNGIPRDLVAAVTRSEARAKLESLIPEVSVVLAHNAQFDRAWLPELSVLPWVCTLRDYPWPGPPARNLADLALRFGVGVVRAHRAFDDVLTLATIMERQGAALAGQIEEAMRRASVPKIKVRALVSIDRKDDAKALGFRWDPTLKRWWKEIPEDQFDSFPFTVSRIA